VIAVDDIGPAMKDVARAGGTVLGNPLEIHGIGHDVSFMDTEGNRVSMRQPLPRAGMARGGCCRTSARRAGAPPSNNGGVDSACP